MKVSLIIPILLISGSSLAFPQSASPAMEMHHDHSHPAASPVSYAELKETVSILDRARQATAKYQDMRVAREEGYEAIGPDVPGMGLHFVRKTHRDSPDFNAAQPPILLYESNPSAPGGYTLVGVSYLLVSPEGPDGQPIHSPFPKSLATWHRHENICVLPDRSTAQALTEKQCQDRGGHFVAETEWMVHAWIWKESPLGVFSPTNPSVK